MATENPSPPARYVTLRDYLRVLRRYRLMIGALAIVGALAGYVAATRQTPIYSATAQISFQDPSQDLSIAGIGSNASQTPGEVASINAATATTPKVMAAAKRRLRTPLSVDDLAAEITTNVAVPSGLLQITATDPDPNLAYRLASAVAGAIVDRDNAQTRAQFAALVGNVQHRIDQAKRQGASAAGQLGFYEDELARLNTVANLARSAQIAYPAQVPTSSSTPGKSRNTVLGLVLGLLLGVIVAFVRDAMDRRLRDLPDVTSTLPPAGARPRARARDGSGRAERREPRARTAASTSRRSASCAATSNFSTRPGRRNSSSSPAPCPRRARRPSPARWPWPWRWPESACCSSTAICAGQPWPAGCMRVRGPGSPSTSSARSQPRTSSRQ